MMRSLLLSLRRLRLLCLHLIQIEAPISTRDWLLAISRRLLVLLPDRALPLLHRGHLLLRIALAQTTIIIVLMLYGHVHARVLLHLAHLTVVADMLRCFLCSADSNRVTPIALLSNTETSSQCVAHLLTS